MQFTNAVTIRRSPPDVFAYLADFENVPRWNYAIAETRKASSGPVGVGTTYRQRRTIPSPSEERFEVVEFVPHSQLAIKGDLGPLHGTLSYRLEAVPEGTRLTNDADLSGSGILRLAAPLAVGRIQDAVAANLQELKTILEASSAND
jgi:uncharacterized protein YndB with AHSA1/START domain